MRKHQDLRGKKIGFWQVGEAFKKREWKDLLPLYLCLW